MKPRSDRLRVYKPYNLPFLRLRAVPLQHGVQSFTQMDGICIATHGKENKHRVVTVANNMTWQAAIYHPHHLIIST